MVIREVAVSEVGVGLVVEGEGLEVVEVVEVAAAAVGVKEGNLVFYGSCSILFPFPSCLFPLHDFGL
jgi:hypothetical protein